MSAWTYIMGLPKSEAGNDGILTVVDRATKMVHLAPVKQTITAADTARLYWSTVGKLHGILRSIVSDRDPRFVSKFWREALEHSGEFIEDVQCLPPIRQMVRQRR